MFLISCNVRMAAGLVECTMLALKRAGRRRAGRRCRRCAFRL